MKKINLLLLLVPFLLQSQTYVFRADIVPDTANNWSVGKELQPWKSVWAGETHATVFAKQTLNLVGGALRMGKNCGNIKYSIDAGSNVVDFNQSMTLNDVIEFRGVDGSGNAKVEYMRVGANVSGTAYLVTRNLDNTTANSWVKNTAYSVVGKWGNGWLDLASYTLPRISMNVQHDSTWNHFTEIERLGDLNGNWGYTSTTWGMAIGGYSNNSAFITIDTVNGVRIRHKNGSGVVSDAVRLEPDGDAYFAGNMTISNAGSITISSFNNDAAFNHVYYGASTPPSPIAGDMWFKQVAGDTSMQRYNGATWDRTSVRMDANGLYADNIYANQITAGTFTGLTFQTAASGKRAVISSSDNEIHFYSTSGEVARIGEDVYSTLDGAYINEGVVFVSNNTSPMTLGMFIDMGSSSNSTQSTAGSFRSKGSGDAIGVTATAWGSGFNYAIKAISSGGTSNYSFYGVSGTLYNAEAITSGGVVSATGGSSTDWNEAHSQMLQWDGGSTNLVAATGRTSLGLGTAALAATGDFAPAAQGASWGTPASSNVYVAVTSGGVVTTRLIYYPTTIGTTTVNLLQAVIP